MVDEQFIPGQRWISDMEPNLGLGTVLCRDNRRVTLDFPASAEQRTYAIGNTPLTRVRFVAGDRVENQSGSSLQIHSVEERNGLIIYQGQNANGSQASLAEIDLNCSLQFNRPQDRLFSGQLDMPQWFDLRHTTLINRQRLERSPLKGLGGARTALLPYQLYIAHEVSRRPVPRVLLADEVGLGKTIEACLILHRQLLTGQASRVLILVPPALLNQWLVELLRRFNLRFSLFDEERCLAIEESDPGDNPFQAEQLILCSSDLFVDHNLRWQQVTDAGWDMLIVDEAHHLQWSEQLVSDEYRLVEALTRQTPAVLLLTATPEQLGRSGHFARLRLLDPDRFHDLASFLEEERRFEPIANLVEQLLGDGVLSADSRALLSETLGAPEAERLLQGESGKSQKARSSARLAIIDRLLDRHGTGRVLFRNSRNRIKGFPERELLSHPLPLPAQYMKVLQSTDIPVATRLTPEAVDRGRQAGAWWLFDPRLGWLISLLRRLQNEKLLLICARSDTAREIELALRTREGIHAALFHEGTSIVERDRAAAWFADPDEGAQLLICSEIGSEGRNFQFAHHLVLFDLPLDPDLLEQRIGRLDRIGQREKIRIHVPHFEEGAQAVMMRWYNQGLNAFNHTCPAGHSIFRQLLPALLECLEEPDAGSGSSDILVHTARQLLDQASETLRKGRDHLLELNSCREPQASNLKKSIEEIESAGGLPRYMEDVLAYFGVESEEHSPGSLILRPGAHMLDESFPGLAKEGMTCTFERGIALVHEERHFLTWEHPLVTGAMEMMVEGSHGSCCCSAVRHPEIKPGSMLLELLFLIECPAPKRLQSGRFLPPTLLHLLLDQQLNDCSKRFPRTVLTTSRVALEPAAAKKLAQNLRHPAQSMLERGETLAKSMLPKILTEAEAAMQQHYAVELERLTALARVNPNVSPEEISALKKQVLELADHLSSTHLRLDAIQLIVAI